VAAPKKYKFGTKFFIPELAKIVGGTGEFVCKDRGPAVERRAASGGKLPVIDIYVSSKAQVAKLAKLKKNTFKVEVR
jgi:hypothetical protein